VDDPRDSRSVSPTGHAQVLRLRKAAATGTASGDELSGRDLFFLLWQALADVLGTAAAATLLRRAKQRAEANSPELTELSITRGALEYEYQLPEAWDERAPEPPRALRELVRELWALLLDLTGTVVVHRLSQVAELRDRGIAPPTEREP